MALTTIGAGLDGFAVRSGAGGWGGAEAAVAVVEDGFCRAIAAARALGTVGGSDFAAAVFLDATRFELFLEDSRLAEPVRQRVEPGDAAELVESSTNVVRLPLGRSLWANMSIAPSVLTPNGDGVNDELVVALDLVDVLTARPVQVEIFDLAGRLVAGVELMGTAGTAAVGVGWTHQYGRASAAGQLYSAVAGRRRWEYRAGCRVGFNNLLI